MLLSMSLSLKPALRLSTKAAVVEHLRWEVCNIPSTVREIAGFIGRSEASVRRVLREMVISGGVVRVQGHRYMLAQHPNFWRGDEVDEPKDAG